VRELTSLIPSQDQSDLPGCLCHMHSYYYIEDSSFLKQKLESRTKQKCSLLVKLSPNYFIIILIMHEHRKKPNLTHCVWLEVVVI